MAKSLFGKLKQQFSKEKPKRVLTIHIKREPSIGGRTMIVSESIYPTFKLLLNDLATIHGVELDLIEE